MNSIAVWRFNTAGNSSMTPSITYKWFWRVNEIHMAGEKSNEMRGSTTWKELYRSFKTTEELDQQYDLAATVENPEEYSEWYLEKSQETRENLDCDLDVSYGPTVEEHLDIFPAAQPDAPIMLFIHGGYWREGSSKKYSFVSQSLVDAGVTTIVVNYELCPAVNMDEIVRQARGALIWVYENAEYYGSDSDQIYISGHSAGGHLTGMLLGTNWEKNMGNP